MVTMRVSLLGMNFSNAGRSSGQQATIIAVLSWATAQIIAVATSYVMSPLNATANRDMMQKTAMNILLRMVSAKAT